MLRGSKSAASLVPTSKSAASLGSPFSSPRGKYSTHSERSPTYASHSLHGGTPGNWQGGRCIACAQGIAHSSREAAVRAKKLLQLEAELEAERGAKVKAELTQARSDAELRRSERERSERERAAKSVQLSESVQLSSFPSESAARRATQEGCVPCRSPSPSVRQEPAHEQKGVQLSEGKLSDQLEAALASALLELKEARAELRKQRDRSEESKSAAEESQQESLRLQRRSSRAEAEAEELREQLRAAQAEQQTLRLRCTAAEEELLAQGSASRIAGRTQQAHVLHAMRTACAPHVLHACAPHVLHACALRTACATCMRTACAPHVHRMCTACTCMCTACAPHAHRMCTACAPHAHKAHVHAPFKFHCRSSPQLLVGGACPHYLP